MIQWTWRAVVFSFGALLLGTAGDLNPTVVNAQEDFSAHFFGDAEEHYDSILKANRLTEEYKEGLDEEKDGVAIIRSIFDKDSDIVKASYLILGIVPILYLTITGLKYITNRGEEEKLNERKVQLTYIILGMVVWGVTGILAFDILDPTDQPLDDDSFSNFYKLMQQLKVFMQYAVGILAMLVGLYYGYQLVTVTDFDSEETVSAEKNFIKSLAFGAAVIFLAEVMVEHVFFREYTAGRFGVDASRATLEITGLINFLLVLVGAVAMFVLVLASLRYVTNFGDEEQTSSARSMIVNSCFALAICFSAYAIVRGVVSYNLRAFPESAMLFDPLLRAFLI